MQENGNTLRQELTARAKQSGKKHEWLLNQVTFPIQFQAVRECYDFLRDRSDPVLTITDQQIYYYCLNRNMKFTMLELECLNMIDIAYFQVKVEQLKQSEHKQK